MIDLILKKIDSKRDSKNFIWKILVFVRIILGIISILVRHNDKISVNLFKRRIMFSEKIRGEENFPLSEIINSFLFQREELLSVKMSWIDSPFFIRAHTSDPVSLMQVFFTKNDYYLNELSPEFIIDGGANIGCMSIKYANLFPNAKIIAVEPEESNCIMLQLNTAKYPNVEILKAAIWSKNGDLSIKDLGKNKDAFTVENLKEGGVHVVGVSIDEILKQYRCEKISILKLDIEGSEKELFSENYQNWINKVDLIIIETHDRLKAGSSETVFNITRENFSHKGSFGEHEVFIKKSI